MAATTSKDVKVHFSSDQHQLNEQAIHKLNEFISSIDLDSDYMFIVSGHTDDDGSMSYNEKLSSNRAAAVKEFLKSQGVSKANILAHSFGENDPLVENISAKDHQKNRRVTVVFEQYFFENMADIEALLGRHDFTEVVINPNKRNYIQGKHGAIVRIPKNSFINSSGEKVDGMVELQMTEAFNFDQFVANGLSTITEDGRMLVSAGMMQLQAFDEQGNSLELNENTELTISLPSAQREDGMELFVSNNGGQWQATGQQAMKMPTFKYPPKPRYVYPKYAEPVYKADLSTKPKRPLEPVRPRPPGEPRKMSFTSTAQWYQFLSVNKIKARDAARYEQALIRYDQRIDRFNDKMEQYQDDCMSFPERRTEFKSSLAVWVANNDSDSSEFRKTEAPLALSDHQARVEKYNERNRNAAAIWRAKCDSIVEAYGERIDSLGVTDMNGMNRYIFSTNKLGWINCDRFYNVPFAQKFNLAVEDDEDGEEKVFVVFTKIKSMMRMELKPNGNYMAFNIPKNEPAAIFAYKVVDGKSMMCYQPMNSKDEYELVFRPAKFAEIRKVLLDLNGGSSS